MDFLNWIQTYWKEVLLVGSSGFDVIAAIVFLVKTKLLTKSLNSARARGTYTVCPHCKTVLELKDLDLFLPGGHKDNNLNGVPDDKERSSL